MRLIRKIFRKSAVLAAVCSAPIGLGELARMADDEWIPKCITMPF